MVKQTATSGGTVKTGRWIQTTNPMTSTSTTAFSVSGDLPKIGLMKCNGNTFLANSSTTANWWCAIGVWNSWQGGIPGFFDDIITTGYLDLYLRIDQLFLKSFSLSNYNDNQLNVVSFS